MNSLAVAACPVMPAHCNNFTTLDSAGHASTCLVDYGSKIIISLLSEATVSTNLNCKSIYQKVYRCTQLGRKIYLSAICKILTQKSNAGAGNV